MKPKEILKHLTNINTFDDLYEVTSKLTKKQN